MHRDSLPADGHIHVGHAPAHDRENSGEILRQQRHVSHVPLLDQRRQLLAPAPRRLVQVVGRQQDPAGLQDARIPNRQQSLAHGGHSGLHVRGPAPVEESILDAGRNEGEMHRVQVAVELEGPPRNASLVPGNHGRGPGPRGLRPADFETFGRQNLRQTVRHFTGVPSGAGDPDQVDGQFRQSVRTDGTVHTIDQVLVQLHGSGVLDQARRARPGPQATAGAPTARFNRGMSSLAKSSRLRSQLALSSQS